MWCLFDFNIFDVYVPQMPKNKDLKQKAYENLIYGYKRVDVLLITIPIAGIYLLAENPNLKTDCSKASFIFFGLTLVTNLISQFTSIYSNTYDYKARDLSKRKCNDQIKKFDRFSKKLSDCTIYFTVASAVFLIIALVLLFLGVLGSW